MLNYTLTRTEVERMSEQEIRSKWHYLMGTLEGDTPKTRDERHRLEVSIAMLEEVAR